MESWDILILTNFNFTQSVGSHRSQPVDTLEVQDNICGRALSFSCVHFFVTPWTVACQAPLWDSPGKNTGLGCYALLQGIFLTQGLNLHLLCLLHCRQVLYHQCHLGSLLFDYAAAAAKLLQSCSTLRPCGL